MFYHSYFTKGLSIRLGKDLREKTPAATANGPYKRFIRLTVPSVDSFLTCKPDEFNFS